MAAVAALAERLDPVVQSMVVVEPLRGQAAPQLYGALVHQASQSQDRRLFRPRQVVVPRQQPVDFRLGDHPGAEGFEEKLADGNDGCNEVVTF